MKVKVSEATNPQLNFMVAKAVGMQVINHNGSVFWGNFATVTPATSWAQGGPIIEREGITISKTAHGFWEAYKRPASTQECYQVNDTPLIAAMRCFVSSKLGDEVEVPEELCE